MMRAGLALFRPVAGVLAALLIVVGSNAGAQAQRQPLPAFTAVAVAGDKISVSQTSLISVHDALAAAMQQCEQKRDASTGVLAACEPGSVAGEAVTTAAQLRQRAVGAKSSGLSLYRYRKGTTEVYLLGSLHLLKPNIWPLHPAITDAFQRADRLVLEVDMAALPAASVQRSFMAAGTLPDEQTLRTTLPAATFAAAEQALAARGLSIEPYLQMRPWLFEQTLVTKELQLYGFTPAAGIEAHFDRLARAAGKPVLQLETLEQQLQLLAGSSQAEQLASLQHTLQALVQSRMQAEINSLLIDWLQGNMEGLYQTTMAPLQDYPELRRFMQALLDQRNVAMAKKIDGWMKQGGRYFIITGAAHLGGPQGLLALLAGQGYEFQQLPRTPVLVHSD